MRISDCSSDVCSSDLEQNVAAGIDLCQRGVSLAAPHGAHDVERRTDRAVVVRHPADQCKHLSRCVALAADVAVNNPRSHRLAEFEPVFAGTFMPMNLDMGERSEEHTSELQSLMRISYAV